MRTFPSLNFDYCLHDISYVNLLMLGATVPDYSLDDDNDVPVKSNTGPGDDDTPGKIVPTKEMLDFFTD